MAVFIIIAASYLVAFVPLAAAFVLKSQKLGCFVAVLMSLGYLAVVARYWYGVIGMGLGNGALPMVGAIAVGIICILMGTLLAYISDEKN